MSDLVIRDARPMGGAPADVLILGGRIAAVGPALEAPAGTPEEAAGGRLAVPTLTDAHTHLDKSLLGRPWFRNAVGKRLEDRIETERAVRRELSLDPHVQSMRHALCEVAAGATLIRSHVDVDTEQGLAALEGVAETRQALAGVVEIEIVAFPQSGLMIRPGTAELLDAALGAGADLVGGLDPCGIDRDPKGHLDVVFGLAERHGVGVDLHLHERGELGAFSLELILERIQALGMEGRAAVSHAFCLGGLEDRRAGALIERIAALDVAILTTAPAFAPVPELARLLEAGVRVGAGNDGVRDTWGPWGTGDMLERAALLGLRNDFRTDEEVETALAVCASGGAEAMGRGDRRLVPGGAGDVLLLDGETPAEAVAWRRPRPLVVHGGRVVARGGAALHPAP